MAYTISKEYTFSASHILDWLPNSHPCSRLHGHNYRVLVELQGDLNPQGFVIDYHDIDAIMKPWIENNWEHRHLNDSISIPTSEHLARLMWDLMYVHLGEERGKLLHRVGVSETEKTWAFYNWQPLEGSTEIIFSDVVVGDLGS